MSEKTLSKQELLLFAQYWSKLRGGNAEGYARILAEHLANGDLTALQNAGFLTDLPSEHRYDPTYIRHVFYKFALPYANREQYKVEYLERIRNATNLELLSRLEMVLLNEEISQSEWRDVYEELWQRLKETDE